MTFVLFGTASDNVIWLLMLWLQWEVLEFVPLLTLLISYLDIFVDSVIWIGYMFHLFDSKNCLHCRR